MNAKKSLLKTLALASTFFLAANVHAEVDPKLQPYETVSGVSGNVSSIGSDTLNNLMTLWAEEFAKFYPNVNIQIQGAGSSTAPPALTQSTANFGPMSREMRASEIQAFESEHGYKPTAVPVAIDLLAVYVNKDNPIEGMTMAEVDAIFSATRRCGHPEDITRWGQVGLDDAWDNRDFALYSRNAVSGTYGYFKSVALCGGDFKSSINEQPGSSSVVQGVTESINGIGYSGIGYRTSGVRVLPLAKDKNSPFAEATAENASNGTYPLARYLYVYINKHPNRPMAPLEAELIKMILSKDGQEVVVRDGYIPLPAVVVDKALAELGLD